ncbi:MAG: winged helix-turn-helix transcriptional regulator [Nitrospirae bacterium]|nr:winged helix-turn-helix transcriptional regulator [Nitrospirota bacterium]
MSKRLFEIHADICKTLGNAKRIEILNVLENKELSVGEIADRLGISTSNVSQHLAVMKQKGILTSRRDKNNIFYKVSNEKVIIACGLMREVLLDRFQEGQKMVKTLTKAK